MFCVCWAGSRGRAGGNNHQSKDTQQDRHTDHDLREKGQSDPCHKHLGNHAEQEQIRQIDDVERTLPEQNTESGQNILSPVGNSGPNPEVPPTESIAPTRQTAVVGRAAGTSHVSATKSRRAPKTNKPLAKYPTQSGFSKIISPELWTIPVPLMVCAPDRK